MTYLVIVLIPKSSYFQNILVMLTALTWVRHNETIELFLAEVHERITESYEGRWMQHNRLYCVESDGQFWMDFWIYVSIMCFFLCFISLQVRDLLCEHFVAMFIITTDTHELLQN